MRDESTNPASGNDQATLPFRVLLVDDHPAMRAGIARVLDGDPRLDIVGEGSTGEEALELVVELKPDIVLMDLSMPGMGGIEAIRALHRRDPDLTVIVLSSHADLDHVRGALDAGAMGYVLKDVDPDELVRAVISAATGGSPLDPRVARVVLDARSKTASMRLTARELEVLTAIVGGSANKRIGYDLGISEKTVKAHVTRIFSELNVSDRTQAAMTAVRVGLVQIDE